MISPLTAFRITAVLGAAGVGLGAFGAHGLHDLLIRNERVDTWEKAVLYQFIHTAAMLVLTTPRFSKNWRGPWTCFLAGILIFSGSLYVLSLTNIRWLGAITPIGGVSFIAGWLWLAIKPPTPTTMNSNAT